MKRKGCMDRNSVGGIIGVTMLVVSEAALMVGYHADFITAFVFGIGLVIASILVGFAVAANDKGV
jgi:hypothetical protein